MYIRSNKQYPQVGASTAKVVLSRLVKLREALSILDDLGVIDFPGEGGRRASDRDDIGTDNFSEGDLETTLDDQEAIADSKDQSEDELEVVSQGFAKGGLEVTSALRTRKPRQIGIAENISGAPSKKRQRKRSQKADHLRSDDCLLNLAPTSAEPPLPVHSFITGPDLLDPIALSSPEAVEKASRKKSLRFYTSKIDAKYSRRFGASLERAGGDVDIPYRSKDRARAAMLHRQENDRHISAESSELDNIDYDHADMQIARDVMRDPNADGYYDLVATEKRAAKIAKKEAYDNGVEQKR